MSLYTSIVIPSAIYATWRTTDKTNRMLNVFNRCLRDIMGVWKDHMTNEELLSSAGIGGLQDIAADRRRRFIEHVLRLPTSRPASLVIDWTPEGKVEDGAGQSRHGRIHVEKILRRWFSDFCYRSKHIHIIDRHLRRCLTKLQEWADTNGFTFSTAKTVCVHFCRLHKFYSDPQLLVNGSPIPVVEEVKSLGIIFDKNSHFFLTCITWKINVQKLLTCYVLSHTPLGVQINKLLLHLYRSLISSKLDYSCIVYGSARGSYLQMLDPIQNICKKNLSV